MQVLIIITVVDVRESAIKPEFMNFWGWKAAMKIGNR